MKEKKGRTSGRGRTGVLSEKIKKNLGCGERRRF